MNSTYKPTIVNAFFFSQVLLSFFFFVFCFFFLPYCGILVSRLGIEPVPPLLETWNFNNWTAEKFLSFF